MAEFTVPLEGGGFMTVNASDPQAAQDNVAAQGGTPAGTPISGGHAAHQVGGVATGGYAPGYNSGGLISAQQGAGAGQVGQAIQQMLDAIASGNKQAFDETVRQWNLVFGLDTKKFEDDVRRFNENLQLAQAGLTGTYQGQQTQQAQQQQYAQQMGMINQAAQLQANPFRQQQAIGQMGRLLGGQGVAGFSAPNTVAGVGIAGGNTQGGLGYLSQMIDDIRDPTANSQSMNQVLQGIPTPNKLNSVEFLRAAPSTQNMVLQGMQEKFGLDPNDALAQIRNTLPGFQAPSTFGQVRR